MENVVHFSFDVPKENKHLIDILNALSKAFNLKSKGRIKKSKNENRAEKFRKKYCQGIVPSESVLRGDELKKARYKKYAE